MRILHLDAGKEMHGGQWQVLRLIEGLAAAGVESTLLARQDAPLFIAARQAGWRVQAVGLTRAVMLLRQHDLIHAHDARTHTMGALLRGRPLIVARRVAFPIGTAQVASRWKYSRAQKYIAVSEHVKDVLIRGGVPEQKISVVYDGVPLLSPAPEPARQIVALPKGASLAREAAHLAGMPIHISTDFEHDLAAASIAVYVSHAEGLGSGVLLAMSAGVPVIASKIGGIPEIIRHGENGLLSENTAEAFAAAIRRLLENPDEAQRIGAAARRTIGERFTTDNMVRRTLAIYNQVLG